MSAAPAVPATGPASSAPRTLALPDRLLRVLAWLSFAAETTIIATGGAVRLTGSGLGCSEWPLCTPESLVPTPELGVHGFIEFGNRTMTGLVGLLALVVLIVTLRRARGRRDLATPAWIVLGGVVAQAVVGGVTVWTGLNPFIVGFHYVASLALVCVTAAYLVRLHEAPGPRERAVPAWFAILTHVTTLALGATILFGVLTTANGPHSGDADVVRNGFDASLLAHVHAWPGYLLLALVAVLVAAAAALRLRPLRWLVALLAVILAQVVVGVVQARLDLPALLVGIHMVLAALSAAAFTVAVLRLKRPVTG